MSNLSQNFTPNNSYISPATKAEPKGSLMTGLAFGVGSELANTSVKGIQNSGLHPHVENPESKMPLSESKTLNSTPIFSSNPIKNDMCKNEMTKLNQCMDKNDENLDKCESQYYTFRACRQDNK